jgi:hypothetical protein
MLVLFLFNVDVERYGRILGFEAGCRRLSNVQAKKSGGIADLAEIFFVERALCQDACAGLRLTRRCSQLAALPKAKDRT